MRDDLQTDLVLDALGMAVTARGAACAGVVDHSDLGQFTSPRDGLYANQSQIELSMGSVGDPWGNAIAETLFASLENELLRRERVDTCEHARIRNRSRSIPTPKPRGVAAIHVGVGEVGWSCAGFGGQIRLVGGAVSGVVDASGAPGCRRSDDWLGVLGEFLAIVIDGDPFWFCLFGFAEVDGEDAVAVVGVDVVGEDVWLQGEAAHELAGPAFGSVSAGGLLGRLALADDDELAIDRLDGEVFGVTARGVQFDDDVIVGFVDVCGRQPATRAGRLVCEQSSEGPIHVLAHGLQLRKQRISSK
jgi:hypothetical protein